MKISSFKLAGRLPGAVSIALKAPPWFRGPSYPALAPPADLLAAWKAKKITWAEYDARYWREVLAKLNAFRVYNDLTTFGGDVILCCWESPGAPCHRLLVATWFKRELRVIVPELEDDAKREAAYEEKGLALANARAAVETYAEAERMAEAVLTVANDNLEAARAAEEKARIEAAEYYARRQDEKLEYDARVQVDLDVEVYRCARFRMYMQDGVKNPRSNYNIAFARLKEAERALGNLVRAGEKP